jgi:hypothetical protein
LRLVAGRIEGENPGPVEKWRRLGRPVGGALRHFCSPFRAGLHWLAAPRQRIPGQAEIE